MGDYRAALAHCRQMQARRWAGTGTRASNSALKV